MKQKRYNLMITGENQIAKLDSLPQRGKGIYVSLAISNQIEKESQKDVEYIKKIVREVLEEKRTLPVNPQISD